MASDPFLEIAKFHPFLRNRDDIADEKSAKVLVNAIFVEIRARFGEETAIKMFAAHVRQLNNKETTTWKNAGLIWQLYHMKKSNISELARIKAGKNKNSAARVESWRQQIHRALKDKRAVAHAKMVWEDIYGYGNELDIRPPKRRRPVVT